MRGRTPTDDDLVYRLSASAYEKLMKAWESDPQCRGMDDDLATSLLDGRKPYLATLRMGVLAVHFEVLAWIAEEKEDGVLGDALSSAEIAKDYRTLIATLEECVAELEREQADIHRTLEPARRLGWEVQDNQAAAAESRARRAEARRAQALSDSAEQDLRGLGGHTPGDNR